MKIVHIINGLGDGGAEHTLFKICKYDIKNKHIVITKGSKENNFTVGLGFNLTEDLEDPSERAVFNIGATFRTSRRFAVVFEGWAFNPFNEPTFLGGPGIRYFRKINRVTARNGAGASTWDFQLLTSPDFEGIIPMFGASRKF